jgi:hypothetical protein
VVELQAASTAHLVFRTVESRAAPMARKHRKDLLMDLFTKIDEIRRSKWIRRQLPIVTFLKRLERPEKVLASIERLGAALVPPYF